MANKRTVKKQIRNICGAMVSEFLSAASYFEGFEAQKGEELSGRIECWQVKARSHGG